MDVSVGEHWEGFVATVVENGRYATASDVVREGLRLVEVNEAKLAALRAKIEASLASGECVSDEEVGQSLDATIAELIREGY